MTSRLKQLRQARGLTLDALAAAMGGIVTKQSLSKYEQGSSHPSPLVLTKLAAALGVKAAHLWAEPTISVEFIAYRRVKGLAKSEQERVESLVTESLEQRVRLQDLMGHGSAAADLMVRAMPVNRLEDADEAATKLRKKWRLGLDPIASITGVLEDHAVHVIEIEAKEGFDGISAVAYENKTERAAAVVTRAGVPGERQRLNLAHELGHLMLNVDGAVDEEKAAFRFGASLLVPAEVLHREVGEKRSSIQLAELLLLKRRFGVSIQALLYRLKTLSIIPEQHYKSWCMIINKRGWRKHEPEEMSPEQPQWLEQAVLRVFSEGLITREEGEAMLGKSLGQPPLNLIERHAFMKLPVEQRRQKMAEQAAELENYYQSLADGGELEGSDFIED